MQFVLNLRTWGVGLFASWAILVGNEPGAVWARDVQTAERLVKTLSDAQPRGGNSELMAQTWKELVAQGPDALLPILSGMSAEKPLALNFLRPALDAVLEKTKPSGETIEQLDAFVKNQANKGVARRQAFEWLVKLAPEKSKALIPTFIDDMYPELRREAVAAKIADLKKTGADDAAKKKIAEGAKKLLDVASESDQVAELAKLMKEGGLEFDGMKHYGFLTDWLLIGTFDNDKELGYEKAYAVEPQPDVSKAYVGKKGEPAKWFEGKASAPEGVVDLNKLIGKEKSAVAYAWTRVDSDKDQEVEIHIGCTTSLKVWINGEIVLQRDEYHHGASPDQHIARCKLKKGVNDLVIKVCQNNQKESWAQKWEFQARFTDFAWYRLPLKAAALPKIPQMAARAN